MIKVGVVGAGNMGKNHVRIYHEMSNVELVGISDKNQDIRESIRNNYNIQAYKNYEDLLSKVEAVSIVTPTINHKEIAVKCLQNNIDCLVEKPISFNVEDAKEIINEAINNNRILAIGHIENFNPVIKKLKEIISNNDLGKILFISSKRVGSFVNRVKDIGIILDLASHDIGVIRYLLDIKSDDCIKLFSSWRGLKNEKGDYAVIIMEIKDIISSIEVNWYTPFRYREIFITGTKAVARVNYDNQKIHIYNYEWTKSIKINKEEPLKIELNDFINSVKNRTKPLVDGNEGLEIIKMAIEAENFKRRV